MATTVGDERKTSTIRNLPVGFYYYLIPRNNIDTATYLGFVDTIQSLTFNIILLLLLLTYCGLTSNGGLT